MSEKCVCGHSSKSHGATGIGGCRYCGCVNFRSVDMASCSACTRWDGDEGNDRQTGGCRMTGKPTAATFVCERFEPPAAPPPDNVIPFSCEDTTEAGDKPPDSPGEETQDQAQESTPGAQGSAPGSEGEGGQGNPLPSPAPPSLQAPPCSGAMLDAYQKLARLERERSRLTDDIDAMKRQQKEELDGLKNLLADAEADIERCLVGLESGTFQRSLPLEGWERAPAINPEQQAQPEPQAEPAPAEPEGVKPCEECDGTGIYTEEMGGGTRETGQCGRCHGTGREPGNQEAPEGGGVSSEEEPAHACGSCIQFDRLEGEAELGWCALEAGRMKRTEPACDQWESAVDADQEDPPQESDAAETVAMECDSCHGSGVDEGEADEEGNPLECEACGGTGELQVPAPEAE